MILFLYLFGPRWPLLLRGLSCRGGERRLLSGCGAQASHCGGFSLAGHVGSGVVAPGLESTGSTAVAHGLSHSAACGVFPHQGLNTCLLHLQVYSLPVSHEGSPEVFLNEVLYICCCSFSKAILWGMWDLSSQPGINPCPCTGVTGLPGKFLHVVF